MIFFALFIAWSPSFAKEGTRALVDPNGFITYPDLQQEKETPIIIKDEPPVRSQDTIGLCYGFAAAAAFDMAYCKTEDINCADQPEEKRVSSIAMSSYSSAERGSTDPQANLNSRDLGNSVNEGGSAAEALGNAVFEVGYQPVEGCAPFDKAVAKVTAEGLSDSEKVAKIREMQLASWKNMKDTYAQYVADKKRCATCAISDSVSAGIDKLKIDFGITSNNTDILKAFGAASFSKLLEQLLIPAECMAPTKQITIDAMDWKMEVGKDFKDYNSSIGKIKEVLKSGTPIIVDGYCMKEKKPRTAAECSDGQHSFLITGFKKVCNTDSTTCRDLVKVHNSWGESWQESNQGGWVDAKETLGRTFYQEGTFHWLQEK